jgi:chromosome segregation ATPase
MREVDALRALIEEKENQLQLQTAEIRTISGSLEAELVNVQRAADQLRSLRAEYADLNKRHIDHMEDHARLRGRYDRKVAELDQRRLDHEAMQALNEILVKDNLDLRQKIQSYTLQVEQLQSQVNYWEKESDSNWRRYEAVAVEYRKLAATTEGLTPQKEESLCQNETVTASPSTPSTD